MSAVGISLCGGGARGIAHIGVLQALSENNIHPQVIAGTSAGALVGCFYAAGFLPTEIFHTLKSTSLFNAFNFTYNVSGLSNLSYLSKIIKDKIPHNSFNGLLKPFYATVANLTDGKCEYMKTGKLSEVVPASCAVPLVFGPVKMNGKTYIDGGFFDNLPIKPIKGMCEKIIAVNVNPHSFSKDPSNIVALGLRCLDLTIWRNSADQIKYCDFLIDVKKAAKFRPIDAWRADELYNAGYQQTLQNIEAIKAAIENKNIPATRQIKL